MIVVTRCDADEMSDIDMHQWRDTGIILYMM